MRPKRSLLSQLMNPDPAIFRNYANGGGPAQTDFQPITDVTTSGTGSSDTVVLSSTRRPSVGGSGISLLGVTPALRPKSAIIPVVTLSSRLRPLSGVGKKVHKTQGEQPNSAASNACAAATSPVNQDKVMSEDDPKQVLPTFQQAAPEKIYSPLPWYVGGPGETRVLELPPFFPRDKRLQPQTKGSDYPLPVWASREIEQLTDRLHKTDE
ncbi:hypothetical protein BDP27DRAFT_1423033 [Rhodocollybia butyracea]|uniref:Uncharacterized protein n=1 Tax=Rhodocollybia butyracea TaxID=206335 RepID=A0A9P5U512_9AGAR|nr:hypothetical protein BDP27DRAFT_1423033 [Rhodocollybia butyracea]